jgi:hypothetical protein
MNKIVLIGIAILAVGLIALPQTFALFAGQHDWYNERTNDVAGIKGIPCMKCHADVRAQMDNMPRNAPHTTGTFDGSDGCIGCHVEAEMNKNPTTEIGGLPGQLHAAAAPECLDCHGDNAGMGYTYYGAPVGVSIFGTTYAANGASAEVHGEFVMNASVTTEELLKGANEACVGCHTHVGVNATWVKPTMLSFKAGVSTTGTWTVSNFRADAGYTNTTGAPVGQAPYNDNSSTPVSVVLP